MSHGMSSCNIIKCGLCLLTRRYHIDMFWVIWQAKIIQKITENSHKYTRDESLGEDLHRRGFTRHIFCTGNTRQSERSQCKGEGNRRQGRDFVFYLNDVKGEPPRLESSRVAALCIYHPLSISIVSLFIPSPLLFVPVHRVRDLCTFPLAPSDETSGEQRFKLEYE